MKIREWLFGSQNKEERPTEEKQSETVTKKLTVYKVKRKVRFVSGAVSEWSFWTDNNYALEVGIGLEKLSKKDPESVGLYRDLSGLHLTETIGTIEYNIDNVEEILQNEVVEKKQYEVEVKKKGCKYVEQVSEINELQR